MNLIKLLIEWWLLFDYGFSLFVPLIRRLFAIENLFFFEFWINFAINMLSVDLIDPWKQ